MVKLQDGRMRADGLVMMEDLNLVTAILAGVEGGGGFGLWRGETQQESTIS